MFGLMADSAAISAAVGVNAGNTNVTLQADAAAASYGFVNGSGGTTVTVNNPPLLSQAGAYVENPGDHQTTPETLVLVPFSQVPSGHPRICRRRRRQLDSLRSCSEPVFANL
jgi:hypothetical protein